MAGEAIDHSLGAWFGLSTMAAAGLGNMASDVLGLGMADSIEAALSKMGSGRLPTLTRAQRRHRSVRAARLAGSCVGISVGCLLGMVPLLFWDAS